MKIYSLIVMSIVIAFFLYDLWKQKKTSDIIGGFITVLIFMPVWIYIVIK